MRRNLREVAPANPVVISRNTERGKITLSSNENSAELHVEENRIKEILNELYTAQKCSFFLEEVMGTVMDNLNIDGEEAVQIVKLLINEGFINTKSFMPKYFLRPDRIRMFPIVLTARAITFLNTNQ